MSLFLPRTHAPSEVVLKMATVASRPQTGLSSGSPILLTQHKRIISGSGGRKSDVVSHGEVHTHVGLVPSEAPGAPAFLSVPVSRSLAGAAPLPTPWLTCLPCTLAPYLRSHPGMRNRSKAEDTTRHWPLRDMASLGKVRSRRIDDLPWRRHPWGSWLLRGAHKGLGGTSKGPAH